MQPLSRAKVDRGSYEDWPPDRVALLTDLWADRSLTCAKIGEMMGVSKDAIIGKARRLNLPMRIKSPGPRIKREFRTLSAAASPPAPKPSPRPKPAKRAPIARVAKSPGTPANLTPTPIARGPLGGVGVLFGRARKDQCAAPLWGETTPKAERYVCGNPVQEGCAYCPDHRALFYTASAYPFSTIKNTDFSQKTLNPRSK